MKRAITNHCGICGKRPVASYNRPKSLHKTKRVVYPNLVRFGDGYLCTRCLKSLRLQSTVEHVPVKA